MDTLRLSPICFPENPYHKLVKGYKLEGDSRSDPIKDCELAYALLNDEINALSRLNNKHPELASAYRKILSETENQLEKEGLDIFFDEIGVKKLTKDEADKVMALFKKNVGQFSEDSEKLREVVDFLK